MIVEQYEQEEKLGIKLINEYNAMSNYVHKEKVLFFNSGKK